MGRNYLAHASGDAINAVLAAAGYNFRRLLAWLRPLFAQNPDCVQPTHPAQIRLKSGPSRPTGYLQVLPATIPIYAIQSPASLLFDGLPPVVPSMNLSIRTRASSGVIRGGKTANLGISLPWIY